MDSNPDDCDALPPPPRNFPAPPSGRDKAAGQATEPALRSPLSSVPMQDLSEEKMLLAAERAEFAGKRVPMLDGIPLLARLGHGGMGVVYLGFHPRFKMEVAVKVLPFHLAERNPEIIERFFREAQIAAKVQSERLVRVFDIHEDRGLHFQVMEYVDGCDALKLLGQWRNKNAPGLREADALEICLAATAGMAAAHAQGVVHRDIKPANILIPKKRAGAVTRADSAASAELDILELDLRAAKLADLGLARSHADTAVTQGAVNLGTPGYMAPEQIDDVRQAKEPADLFSMGATLYALLTGDAPYAGTNSHKVLTATLNGQHIPVRQKRPEISVRTADLIEKCLRKSPRERYANAEALLAEIKECRDALLKSAPPPDSKRAAASRAGWLRRVAIVAVLLVLGAGTPLFLGKFKATDAASDRGKIPPPPPPIKELALDLGKDVKLELMPIAAGSFMMGTDRPDADADEKPAHTVRIEQPYYMSKYEVTQEQYQLVLGKNPSEFKGDRKPVDRVSWSDAQNFCRELTERTSGCFRLPTEAEWEYACGAGSRTRYASGDTLQDLERVAWFGNKTNGAQPVGQKEPNAWGLYDMHGNVWEWCQNDFYAYSPELLSKAQPNHEEYERKLGLPNLRGGSWFGKPVVCCTTARFATGGQTVQHDLGFRVVMDTNKLNLGSGVMLDLVLVPAGEPAPDGKSREPFYIGKFEITQEQYAAVMGHNPAVIRGPKNPVETVSWTDAMAFCQKLSAKSGRIITLPTEAEWEFACRAGTQTAFSFGENQNKLKEFGNYCDASEPVKTWRDPDNNDRFEFSAPVGSYLPNAWGLFDMHGNVDEWCLGPDPRQSGDNQARPRDADVRFVRGGSYNNTARECTSAARKPDDKNGKSQYTGFRVVVK